MYNFLNNYEIYCNTILHHLPIEFTFRDELAITETIGKGTYACMVVLLVIEMCIFSSYFDECHMALASHFTFIEFQCNMPHETTQCHPHHSIKNYLYHCLAFIHSSNIRIGEKVSNSIV